MTTQLELKEKASTATSTEAAKFLHAWVETRRFNLIRNVCSLLFFVSAAAVWFMSLGRLDVGQEGLPWYLILGFVAASSVRFLRFEKYPPLALAGLPKSKEPLKLSESLGMVFLIAAFAIYLMAGIELIKSLDQKRETLLQVIDIQLLSDKDFKDNNQPLPGMKPQEKLRKRTADVRTQQGELSNASARKSAESAANKVKQDKKDDAQKQKEEPKKKLDEKAKEQNEKPKEQPKQKENDATDQKAVQKTLSPELLQEKLERLSPVPLSKNSIPKKESSSATLPMVIPKNWQTKTVTDSFAFQNRPIPSISSARSDQPFLTEVRPLEMVELIENDGELDGVDVFQRGGKSNGGKGAENNLSLYLKELHKKIKKNWSPPRGFSRKVELIFRLKRDGHVAEIRMLKSSGEQMTDKAAIKAIALATQKADPLPQDFTPNYLDVIYTFKYNVDELQEIPNTDQ